MNRRPSLGALLQGSARCELFFTAPFAALGGGLYGVELARTGGLPWLPTATASGLALVAFVAFQLSMEPWVVARLGGREGRWGPLVAYFWDVATGTVVGLPLVAVLGAPTLPGVGAAVTAGALYGYVMGFVVCGEGAEVAVRTLLTGGGIRRRPDHSMAQALEQRGELAGALETYRNAQRADPRDPTPYLGAARVLERLGRSREAVETLRDALARAHLDPAQEVLLLQRMASLWEGAGRPEAVAPDLARYLERAPEGPAAPWARAELAALKDEMARRMGREPSDP